MYAHIYVHTEVYLCSYTLSWQGGSASQLTLELVVG